MHYLGIDLATKKTGVVLLDFNKSLIRKKTIELLEFKPENFLQNFKIFKEELTEMMPEGELRVGIELSNFGLNAKFANYVHFYAGMLFLFFKSNNKNNDVKFYNADRWFSRLKILINEIRPSNEILREERKQIARAFTLKQAPSLQHSFEVLTEDECDAFCVAYFFDECYNTITEISENKHKKKSAKLKKQSKKKRLEKISLQIEKIKIQIKKYEMLGKVKKPTQAQILKYIKLKNELEKLMEEKNGICKE